MKNRKREHSKGEIHDTLGGGGEKGPQKHFFYCNSHFKAFTIKKSCSKEKNQTSINAVI